MWRERYTDTELKHKLDLSYIKCESVWEFDSVNWSKNDLDSYVAFLFWLKDYCFATWIKEWVRFMCSVLISFFKEIKIVNEGFLNSKIQQRIGHCPVPVLGSVLEYRSLWQKNHIKTGQWIILYHLNTNTLSKQMKLIQLTVFSIFIPKYWGN